MQKKLIYIIDDEADICDLISTELHRHGYDTRSFQTGAQATHALNRRKPDLCIIDLGLPDMDGIAIVRQLCDSLGLGVIIISGRDSTSDRVLGLEFGADDYLIKPFDPRELVARVNSLFRRLEHIETAATRSDKARKAAFAGWLFDPSTLTLNHQERSKSEILSAAEAALLTLLLRSARQILSRDQLLQGYADPFDRSIDVRMSRIRKKIEQDPRHPTIIKTVYGAGYILTAEVDWIND
ncbi:DNA-binding response regulator [Marinobacterium zhoushanense]|uniref:DNA-binding response regulator n=1 Tax=Marinobacterium zhoushanense TaxID=1679163 RepID=A0ABQ1KLI5_9GAMM|nr:response regulator transcription factor [Marinobacterium zhoushanense]GGC03138.1 DNA-binding response regulator [Marinobacterium zhoushanense]